MCVDGEDITPSASFVSLGLDSLEMAQLVIELEEAFPGVEIFDDDLRTLITVQDVANYADQKRPVC